MPLKPLRRTLALLALGLLPALATPAARAAEVTDDGPAADRFEVLDVRDLDAVLAPPLDLERLGAEDAARAARGEAPRFAVTHPVAIGPAERGTWEDLGHGLLLWRLRLIGSAEAASLNLGFDRFELPPSARLRIYPSDGRRPGARAFTAADNEQHGQLWTPVLPGNDLIVELEVRRAEAAEVELRLAAINQGYRAFGAVTAASYDKSGGCNLDVACLDAGDTWREEKGAVGLVTIGGSTYCSGALVNDVAGDRRMFFLSANHCSFTAANAPSVVVYWNYENTFCRAPGSAASGQPGNGTFAQFHSGAIFRAAYAPSDFALIELDDPAVPEYNPYWAGWNRSAGNFTCTAAGPCATLHHPGIGEKRITYATTNIVTTGYYGTASPGDGSHLWVHWATDPPGPFTVPGVTEPGSSGSPLFDANGRCIGQLHGGPSICGATGDNLSDYYGRFSVSWNGGGTSATRLASWLDPAGTGASITNGLGFPAGNTPPVVNIATPVGGSVHGLGGSLGFTGGASDAQDGFIGANLIWFSSLNGNIGTGTFFNTSTLSAGTHTITASVTDSGGLVGSASITLTITGTATPLTNGVPVTGLADSVTNQKLFSLPVPTGAANLRFETALGSGGSNLYVRRGSLPTLQAYDCASTLSGTTDSCTFATPEPGTWFVLLDAFSFYSGVRLTGSYQTTSGPVTLTLVAVGSQDGRLIESSETSGVGGAGSNFLDASASALRIGDESGNQQYKTLLSFDTSAIPDNATITAATLRLKRGFLFGTNPFTTHGICVADLHSSGYGGSPAFADSDFQAIATVSSAATLSNPATNGAYATGSLTATARGAINKAGPTQFRIYFTLDDNDNAGADYLGFYSGDSAAGNQPELVITYTP